MKSAHTQPESLLQGAYIYYDSNDGKWIRSGKVTRRSFSDRHTEHQKAAGKQQTSKFYTRYPTKDNKHLSNLTRKGYFDNLIQYVAIGFLNDKEVDSIFKKSFDDGGLFYTTEDEAAKVEKNKKANMTDMVAYLFEMSYDLSISPTDNVSSNPGFESFIGVW